MSTLHNEDTVPDLIRRYGRYEVAGQLAQEAGDHASARWAREQQLRQSRATLDKALSLLLAER